MATQAERIEALENDLSNALERISDLERHIRDGEALEELENRLKAMDAALNLAATATSVESLRAAVEGMGQMIGNAPEATSHDAEFNGREMVLKAFRQIEAVANHINVKLPA